MVMIRLTVRQMEYFDALAQTLHFGRAAEMAGVSQPALSSQIAEMEEKLGCRLFERGGKAVRLTDEATALQPRIERLLSELRDIEQTAGRGDAAMEGRFRLGIIPTVAPYLLPQILPEIRSRFPRLQLELREAVTATLIEETAARRLDAFIAASPLGAPSLTEEALFVDRFFLAVPADDPAFAAPPVAARKPGARAVDAAGGRPLHARAGAFGVRQRQAGGDGELRGDEPDHAAADGGARHGRDAGARRWRRTPPARCAT